VQLLKTIRLYRRWVLVRYLLFQKQLPMSGKDISSIPIIYGDLLEAEEDILGHQVNCQGVMGSGIAAQFRKKYAAVYEGYKDFCYGKDPRQLLGACQLITTGKKTVANLFGQLEYGREPVVYTDYEALRRALQHLKNHAQQNNQSVALPYLIGCGLANGDWNVVSGIIGEVFADYPLTLYRYSG
jgi:O-acetyl-ADP-ribose deacetylase (regulator of RNase III)